MRVRGVLLALSAAFGLGAAGGGLAAQSSPGPTDRWTLLRLVAEVQDTDFRGDLDRLRALVDELEPFTREPAMARAARYWRGFAYWRRALNGANEADAVLETVERDFADATREFRAALALDSTDVEAQIGAAAGLMARGYFHRSDLARANVFWREAQVLLDAVERRDPGNPRLLFLTAGRVYWSPPVAGGDQQRAIDMVNEGLGRIHRLPGPTDPLVPGWGEAELHMLVAFFHANRATPDLASAERHARAALAFHPQWHYVRDILLSQIAARGR